MNTEGTGSAVPHPQPAEPRQMCDVTGSQSIAQSCDALVYSDASATKRPQ